MEQTPEQALSILDQAASRATLTRQEHVAVQQAVQILAQALRNAQAPPEEELA